MRKGTHFAFPGLDDWAICRPSTHLYGLRVYQAI